MFVIGGSWWSGVWFYAHVAEYFEGQNVRHLTARVSSGETRICGNSTQSTIFSLLERYLVISCLELRDTLLCYLHI